MIELACWNLCTGCGACAYVCSKQCITMRENEIGVVYPEIDGANCINCSLCQKFCPILNPVSSVNPRKAYAAWSSNEEERRTSASGGIAAEIYKEAFSLGVKVAGAVINKDFSVTINLVEHREGLKALKNSKYVFSSAYSLYPKLKELLINKEKVVVIGLPCQIAAIRKLFKDNENLILVDLVCHGTTPYSYLIQHINKLELEYDQVAEGMSFRDPCALTSTFTFTLYNSQKQRFYSKRTKDRDTYQFGYHKMVTYRENCYHCVYAQEKRISDLTLSDYKGLGKLASCSFSNKDVSCVLVHTQKGEKIIEELIRKGKIIAEERPVREPVLGDPQLRHPSLKKAARYDFEKFIWDNKGDFEKTMMRVLPRELIRMGFIKMICLPRSFFRRIKKKIL